MFSPTHQSSRAALAVKLMVAAGLAVGGLAPTSAVAAPRLAAVQGGGDVDSFYDARGDRPLWFAGANRAAADALMTLLDSASLDRITADSIRLPQAKRALAAAADSNDDRDIRRADRALSESFVRYVRAMRDVDPTAAGWVINDAELTPRALPAAMILEDAASARSLPAYVATMAWMDPMYVDLRQAFAAARKSGDGAKARVIRANMERARLLPGASFDRYVRVNIASQRLEMIEHGRVVGSMKVVAGKPEMPTPMMAAMIRYTNLNPYWNLPPDLVAERVAPNVLKDGQSYLVKKGYVVLSDWSNDATKVSPTSVDWNDVAAGKTQLRMRQAPGDLNAMGQMKFMFPNPQGVYLHDTPQKDLMDNSKRLFSAGCVRLEQAPKLALWLYGRKLDAKGASPDQRVDLDRPVPVYLAYFTAVPQGGQVTMLTDIYHRDSTAMADASLGRSAAGN